MFMFSQCMRNICAKHEINKKKTEQKYCGKTQIVRIAFIVRIHKYVCLSSCLLVQTCEFVAIARTQTDENESLAICLYKQFG